MAELSLTMALAHYDRHVPFLDGAVTVDGVALTVLDVGQGPHYGRHGTDRHERMLQKGEFDVAEVSFSSYLMAKDRGLPFTAIPVFPRRLFSQSQVYTNRAAGIREPGDLAGKRVGLNSYQTTLSVLAKGDLQHEYGVPWKEIRWVTFAEETIPFDLPAGVAVERAPQGRTMDEMLVDGSIQALMMPLPPPSILRGDPRAGRLFSDARQEEINYFRKNGFFPIMHTVVMKDALLKSQPWLVRALLDAFERARQICQRYYQDPNWSRLAWARHLVEEERRLLGPDPWPNGVARNRANIERFVGYSHEQGLISGRLSVERLFAETTLDT